MLIVDSKPLISVIVCSTDIKLRDRLYENISEKIGCEFEFLFKDNTTDSAGLCQVYNSLALEANGEYLCFVHEDVLLETSNWANILIEKAKELKTGIIGFAGSSKFNGLPFWHNKNSLSYNYIQLSPNGYLYSDFSSNNKDAFSEVKVLDGMFLFCREEVWRKYKFDEELFKKFHMYDMDFSFSVSNEYTNYVCHLITVKHFSLGNINSDYYKQLIVMYEKWKDSPGMDESLNKAELIESVTHEMVFKNQLAIIDTLCFLRKINLNTSFKLFFISIYFCLRFKVGTVKSKFKLF